MLFNGQPRPGRLVGLQGPESPRAPPQPPASHTQGWRCCTGGGAPPGCQSLLFGRAGGFVLALNSGSNCSTGSLVGSSPLPGSTPRETLKEGCSWGLVPVGQPWAWQWESWRQLSRQQGQGRGHSQEQVGSIPAAPRPPIQEGLLHGPSIAQAFLIDGGASNGVGREGAKREGQIEGRVEERERWGTQADRQGARETKRCREMWERDR